MRKLTISAIAALFVSVFTLGLSSAKADTLETLSFTGTATCQDTVFNCGGDGSGTATGSYTLDVNTQTIVGPWSFTTPFAVIASTDPTASASVTLLPPPGFQAIEVVFEDLNPLDFIRFDFNPSNTQQTGVPIFANACQNIGGTTSCQPQYGVTGTFTISSVTTTTPTPEPASVLLLGLGALALPFISRSALRRS